MNAIGRILIMIMFLVSWRIALADLFLHKIETTQGAVSVGKNEKKDIIEVKVRNSLVFTTHYDDAVITAVHGESKKPDLLLLSFFGGNACAGFYRVLDLTVTPPHISKEFGNCGDLVEPKTWGQGMKENPSFSDGVWRIALTESQTEIVWYRYEDGHVIEEGKEKSWNSDEDSSSNESSPYGNFCIAMNQRSKKNVPQEELIKDMLVKTKKGGGFSGVVRRDLAWKQIDLNGDGRKDWILMLHRDKDRTPLGDYSSVYLAAPKGSDCPENNWCYAGSLQEDDIMDNRGALKCEGEYKDLD